MFGDNRQQMRHFFQTSWRKHLNKMPLSGIEVMVVDVIRQHPEYHSLLNGSAGELARDFRIETGQTNPFLHMGMHITLAEQVSTNRPPGIRELHQNISQQLGDAHQAEHKMMECLGKVLWEAQNNGKMPDEQVYIQCLTELGSG